MDINDTGPRGLVDIGIFYPGRSIAFHIRMGVRDTQIFLADLYRTGDGYYPFALTGIAVTGAAAIITDVYIGIINGLSATEIELFINIA